MGHRGRSGRKLERAMLRFNEKWLGLSVLVVPGSEAVSRTHLSRLLATTGSGILTSSHRQARVSAVGSVKAFAEATRQPPRRAENGRCGRSRPEAFGAAGRRSFAPFAVRNHHRAG